MTAMVFDEFDLATMRAAAQGFSPNDWDADPGDPEHGPAPDVQPGLASMILMGVERVMFWVDRDERDGFVPPDVHGGAPYWVDNTMLSEYQFDMRLERELPRKRRWAS